MRSVLVIGGSGFIGTAIVKELQKLPNVDIAVFDQTPPGADVPFVKGSIMDYPALRKAVEGRDSVVHLAAMLGVANCQQRPGDVIRTNLTGTATVLRVMRECGVKKLLFSSSSEIYGNGNGGDRFHEDDIPRPRSLYARTKILGEAAIRTAAASYGISCSVVRYFNVYGAEQRSDFVVPTFVDRALTGRPLIVHGDGSQLRTFTFVEDAARGTVLALQYQHDQPGWFGIFNIGSAEVSSIQALAELVNRQTGNKQPIEHRNFDSPTVGREPAFEIHRRIPATDRAREKLNFTARISLEEGVRRVIEARAARALAQASSAA